MTFRGPHRDVEIPDVHLTEYVLAAVDGREGQAALIDGADGRTLTYGEVRDRIHRIGGGLAAHGLRKGDTLAVLLPNSPDYGVAFHGAAWAGARVTTVNPVYKAREVAHQIHASGATYAITTPEAAEKVPLPPENVFTLGESFEALLEADPMTEPVPVDPREDVVALPFSSGTGGKPKGAMLTHRNLVANLRQNVGAVEVLPTDVFLTVLPYFHIYGLTTGMNLGFASGCPAISVQRFDLEQFLALIQDHQVTVTFVVPPIALALAKHPMVERFDLSSMRLILSGAATLTADIEVECAEKVGCRVGQGFGMTESSPVTHIARYEQEHARPGTFGVPAPNTEVRVVDPSGNDVPQGERGEMLVRGPQVMKGYHDDPEATARTIDADGWLHTGDMVEVDETGHFVFVERIKELIKVKGFQVAPAELEELLLEHPAVADAAVVPFPDLIAGELPKAFVVLKGEATVAELRKHVAQQVSSYKKLHAVEFVDEIPRDESGKIRRRVLVERERERLATVPG